MITRAIPRPNPMITPIIREAISNVCIAACIVGATDGCVVDGHICIWLCCIVKIIDSLSSNSIKVKERL